MSHVPESGNLTRALRKQRDGRRTHRRAGLRWTLHDLVGVVYQLPQNPGPWRAYCAQLEGELSWAQMSTGKQSQVETPRRRSLQLLAFANAGFCFYFPKDQYFIITTEYTEKGIRFHYGWL